MKKMFLLLVVTTLIMGILFAGNVLAQEKIKLEVGVFFGASGLEWTENIARNYEKLYPNVSVEVWGDVNIEKKVQARLVAGNPPDICAPCHRFNHWAAIYEGQVVPVDEVLDSKAYDQDMTWRETFLPGMLEPLQYEGKTWMIPPFRFVFMWWTDAALWEKYGWKVPETKDELLALVPKIEAVEIAPMTAMGVNPLYFVWGCLLPVFCRIGGLPALVDAMNLVPGAWNTEAFIEAARFWQEFVPKHFQKGWQGMDHTQSQIEYLLGHAAMIPGHSILEHEMREVLPATVKMRAMKIPSWESGKPYAEAAHTGGERPSTLFITSACKHPKVAMDFLKFMTSLGQIHEILEAHGIPVIKGVSGQIPSDAARSAVRIADEAPKTYDWRNTVQAWYPKLDMEIRDGIARVIRGEMSPEDFALAVEKKAAETRADDNIPKHVYVVP